MTLDGIRVNHGALDQAAADLGHTVTRIDERLQRLTADLAPLRSDWSGNAQQAYQVAQQRWDGAVREMRDLLAQTRLTVHQSNLEYRAADRRGAAHFGG